MSGPITDLVRTLVAGGATPELILAAVETVEARQQDALEKRRASDRERQSRLRSNVKSRDITATPRESRPRAGVEGSSSKEEITEKSRKEDTSPSARSTRGSRIPDDFVPDIDAAFADGLSRRDAELQAKNFCDYWRAKPGKDGLKADWPATWRVWF